MATEKFNSLDFDDIKSNIKTFLSSKAEFADHNFEGSTWALILDALAYSAHYTGVYSNMALSETFLDSAQLRNSVVSRAKEIGYIPTQTTASTARLTLELSTTAAQTIIVPAGTKFNATVNLIGYVFTTLTDYTMAESTTGNYTVDIDITQGILNNINYTVVNSSSDQYIVYDSNVDTKSLAVTVNGIDFVRESKFVNIDNTSNVYYIEETLNQKLEVKFGDGVLGVKPEPGDTVIIDWLATDAEAANGINVFEMASIVNAQAVSAWTTTTLSRATGGAPKDSIEKIKFLAPKIYSAQNRLVTSSDYTSLLLNNFPSIKSVSVWGGEDNIPQLFGKVFVSIVTNGAGGDVFGSLTTQDKTDFINYMNTYKIMSIIPELIDPNFVLLDLNAEVSYDPRLTNSTSANLSTAVSAKISEYITNNLQIFNGTLRLSKLLSDIDNVDKSILDSLVSLQLAKVHNVPSSDIPSTLTLDFSRNELSPGSFTSSVFNASDIYSDDSNGNVFVRGDNVGSIDYVSGQVTINNVNFAPSTTITFKATPISLNVSSKLLSILDEGTITVNMNGVV